MGSGQDRLTAPELALIAAVADRGGALILPSALQDPVITSLEAGGHLVRLDPEAAGEATLTHIRLTRSGWDHARRQRDETGTKTGGRGNGYHRPDMAPDAIARPWRS
jgi:hypothetical protein